MKRVLILVAVMAIVTMGFTGKPLVKEKLPVLYTSWTEWSDNDICCSMSLILWQTATIGAITAGGGTYAGLQTEELWPLSKRYRLAYMP